MVLKYASLSGKPIFFLFYLEMNSADSGKKEVGSNEQTELGV